MAWEWVAPVVTGVVGVAGLWATYATGRQARIAASDEAREHRAVDREQRHHHEKQTAYLNLLEAASDARAATRLLNELAGREPRNAELMEATSRRAQLDLTRAREHVRLVGPEPVLTRALAMHQNLTQALRTATLSSDKRTRIDVDLNSKLVAEMKLDLGYELAEIDRATLPVGNQQDALLAGEAAADSLRTGEAP